MNADEMVRALRGAVELIHDPGNNLVLSGMKRLMMDAAALLESLTSKPANDPLTLVHCRDCTNYRPYIGQYRGKCLYYDERFDVGDDHFCGYGVLKCRKPERSEG